MSTTQILAKVTDQSVQLVNLPLVISSGSVDAIEVSCEFDSLWDGYGVTAVFYRDKKSTVHQVLRTDGVFIVPSEVLAAEGSFYMGFLGAAENVRTTEVVRVEVVQGAIRQGAATPTPNIFEQLLASNARLDARMDGLGSRMDELVAMRSEAPINVYSFLDHDDNVFVDGEIRSNGFHAEFTGKMGNWTIEPGERMLTILIPFEFAPFARTELTTWKDDVVATVDYGYGGFDGPCTVVSVSNNGQSAVTFDEDSVPFYGLYPLLNPAVSELTDVRVDNTGKVNAAAGVAVRALETRIAELEAKLATLEAKEG